MTFPEHRIWIVIFGAVGHNLERFREAKCWIAPHLRFLVRKSDRFPRWLVFMHERWLQFSWELRAPEDSWKERLRANSPVTSS